MTLFVMILLLSILALCVSASILEAKFEEVQINEFEWEDITRGKERDMIGCSLRCAYLHDCDALKYDSSQGGDVCQLGHIIETNHSSKSSININVMKKVFLQSSGTTTDSINTTTTTTTMTMTTTTTSMATSSSTTTATTTTTTIIATTTTAIAITNTIPTITTITTPCIDPPKNEERQKCIENPTKVVNGIKAFLKVEGSGLENQQDTQNLCRDMNCRLPTLKNKEEIEKAVQAFIYHASAVNSGGFWLDLANYPLRNCIGEDCFNDDNTLAWGGCENVDIDLFYHVEMYTYLPTDPKQKQSMCVRYIPGHNNGNISSFPCTNKLVPVCMCLC